MLEIVHGFALAFIALTNHSYKRLAKETLITVATLRKPVQTQHNTLEGNILQKARNNPLTP